MARKISVKTANVLIYSDNLFAAIGITALVKKNRPNLRVAHIQNAEDVSQSVSSKLRIVVVVATATVNPMTLLQSVSYLRSNNPALPFMLLYDYHNPVVSALLPGIPELCMTTSTEQIMENLTTLLLRKPATGQQENDVPVLTPRQREVLGLLACGASAQDVSAILGISLKTAYVHRRDILLRMNIGPTYFRGVFTAPVVAKAGQVKQEEELLI